MELQLAPKESTQLNLDAIIANFYSSFLSQLSEDNGLLQKSCLENSEEIQMLRQEKLQLFNSICNVNNVLSVSNRLASIFHMKKSCEVWRHSLEYGLQKVQEGVERHSESCLEWKRDAEKILQIPQDDFTMKPYHDVENEVNRITVQVDDIRKKIQEITAKTAIRNLTMEAEFKELLADIAFMEKYEKEMRSLKEQLEQELSDKKRQIQLEAFHCSIGSQNISDIERENEELQQQIVALESYHLN